MSSPEMSAGECLLLRLRKGFGKDSGDLLPSWGELTERQQDVFTRAVEELISSAFTKATGNLVAIDNLFFDREAEEGRS